MEFDRGRSGGDRYKIKRVKQHPLKRRLMELGFLQGKDIIVMQRTCAKMIIHVPGHGVYSIRQDTFDKCFDVTQEN